MQEVWKVLPALEELQPFLNLLLARSAPDPERTWSGAGEMETVGDRYLTDVPGVPEIRSLAEASRTHLEETLQDVLEALLALTRNDRAQAARVFLRLAAREEAQGRWGRAEEWARSAFEVARDASDPEPASTALRRRGRAVRAQGRLDEALTLYRAGHDRARVLGDHRGAAEGAVGAGNVLEEQGRWEAAAEWYGTALEILDSVEEPLPERWHALLNLHIVHRSRGALDESRPFLDRAEAEVRALADASAAPFLGNARGQMEMLAGRPHRAEAAFREALAEAPSPGARVTIRLNLAESLLARDRLLEAAEEARAAEAEAVGGGLPHRLPEVYRLLGRVAAARGNPDAFVLFERALELLRAGEESPLEEAMTLQAYARAEADRGDQESSADLMGRAMTLYARLGISEPRHPWTDFFGPADTRPPHPFNENPTP
jgi:tetratricopeptide (TPR) repeat protein